jgi:uncharacterized protein (TIGR00251 family)
VAAVKDKTQNLRLHVRLTPKASRDALQGWIEDTAGQRVLKASVTAVPEKGKANKALIELLADEFEIPKSAIEIVRGETDRNKYLIIKNVSEETISRILAGQVR